MRALDLAAEYRTAIGAVTPRFRRRLGELGFVTAVDRVGLVGVMRIAERAGGLWEPDDAGAMAVIIPAWDGPISAATDFLERPELLADLVAWQPRLPGHLLTRAGIATVLGGEALAAALLAREPLRLFRDPAHWARAGASAAGAVVIDWSIDIGLLDLPAIIADDTGFGVEVKRRLKELRSRMVGRLPQIRVPIAAGATP